MQSIILEDLTPAQIAAIRPWLSAATQPGPLPGIFWLIMPRELLSTQQGSHYASCGEYYLAVVMDEHRGSLRLELLVRARNNLHCECMAMSSQAQREFALNFWDRLMREAHEHDNRRQQ
jgi:hypothetical protein